MTFDRRRLQDYLCIALLLLLPILAWTNDADECRELVKAEEFQDAFPVCESAAEQGDADAQFNLGVMYHKGEGVIGDPQEAYFWLLLAAYSGNGEAYWLKEEVKEYLSPDQISAATDQAKLKQIPLFLKFIFAALAIIILISLWVLVRFLVNLLTKEYPAFATLKQPIIIAIMSIPASFLIVFPLLSLLVGFAKAFSVVVTFLGPLLALLLSIGTYERQQKQQRRIKLFNTLVALKKYDFSYERAQALNEVKLEFNEGYVGDTWAKYVEYMENSEQVREEKEEERRYDALLNSMKDALGDESRDIHHSFAPQAHLNLEKLDANWKTSLLKVLVGEEPIAIRNSERGEVEALYNQGERYRDGDGVRENPEKAVRIFKKIAEKSEETKE